MAGRHASVDSFSHLRTMDGNILIDLEAEFHVRTFDRKHRDFQQAMEAIRPADDH
jgi:hypothetical protein